MKYEIKITQIVIPALLVAFGFYFTEQVEAQTVSTVPGEQTITLTKKVEVYDLEETNGAVDQYQVKRGDSVLKILQKRGLLRGGVSDEKLLDMVRRLNPNVKNLNTINVGENLNLPSAGAGKTPALPAVKAAATSPPGDALPAAQVARQAPLGASATSPASPTSPTSAPGFLSGNAGPLATEPNSQVVYRTVKIRPGDTLEKLLRREGMDVEMIYSHLLKTTRRLNPNMNNTDLIYAGAELKIPAAGAYLQNLAGVDPQAVKIAAAAQAQGNPTMDPEDLARINPASYQQAQVEAPYVSKPKAPVITESPQVAKSTKVEKMQTTLGLVFTRLGAKITSRGNVQVKAGAETINIDTAQFPMVETASGSRIILDIGSRMAPEVTAILKKNPTIYHVFSTSPTESLGKALERLWPMCNYYRVYNRTNTYEGGGDVKLKISADWIIWPTEAAWKAGQPVVINRLASENQRTSPQWSSFLEANGFTMVDIYQNAISDPPQEGKSSSGQAKWNIVELNPRYSTLFAAEIIKAMGGKPEMGPRIKVSRGPEKDTPISVPLMWKVGNTQVLLDFGDIPRGTIDILRQDGYRVLTVELETESIIKGVLEGFQAKVQDELVLRAPGDSPKMSITVKGWNVTYAGRKSFITKTYLPPALLSLGQPGMTVLAY